MIQALKITELVNEEVENGRPISTTWAYNKKNRGEYQCVMLPIRDGKPRYLNHYKIVKIGETVEEVNPCDLIECEFEEAVIQSKFHGEDFYFRLPDNHKLMK